MAKRQQKRLRSLRAVQHYLKTKGYNCTTQIYTHAKEGKLKSHSEGGYTVQAALSYAKAFLERLPEEKKKNLKPLAPAAPMGPDKVTMAKRVAEAKKLAAQARLYERKAQIQEGEWVRADTLEKALAQRAAIFKSDIENFIRSNASEMCHIVEGDDMRIPDLISFWLERFEILLGRYAQQ